MANANDIGVADNVTIGNAVSAVASPAFVSKAKALPLVYKEVFPANSGGVIKFRKADYAVGEEVAESTDYTYGANGEVIETSVTCTQTKKVSGSRLSVEHQAFAGPYNGLDGYVQKNGEALGRTFDAELIALFSGLTNQVINATCSVDALLDAQYYISNSMQDAFSGKLVAFVNAKAVTALQKELSSTAATAFGNLGMLGLLDVKPGAGYKGNCAGVDIYQATGFGTSTTFDIGGVWDPEWCFAAGVTGQNFAMEIERPRAANGIATGILLWTFFKIVEWNDGAGVEFQFAT